MSRLHHGVYSENKKIMGGLLKRNICSTVFLCNSRVIEKGQFPSVVDSFYVTVRTCHILYVRRTHVRILHSIIRLFQGIFP